MIENGEFGFLLESTEEIRQSVLNALVPALFLLSPCLRRRREDRVIKATVEPMENGEFR